MVVKAQHHLSPVSAVQIFDCHTHVKAINVCFRDTSFSSITTEKRGGSGKYSFGFHCCEEFSINSKATASRELA